jgi:hypothetical protein
MMSNDEDLEVGDHDPFDGTVLAFTWRDWESHTNIENFITKLLHKYMWKDIILIF